MVELLQDLITDTTNQIKVNSIGKNGLIRKVYLIKEKRWYEFNKPDDFGDHTPFITFSLDDSSFAKNQMELWKKRMIEYHPIPKFKFPLPWILETKNVDDMLHGLIINYVISKDIYFFDEAKKISDSIIKNMQMRSGCFSTVMLPYIHMPLPEGCSPLKPNIRNFHYACASSDGLIAEKLLDLGSFSKNSIYIDAARKCLDGWMNTRTFKEYGLFPDYAIPTDSSTCQLMKTNSNLGFALLRSAMLEGGRRHKYALFRLINSLRKYYVSKKGVAKEYFPGAKTKGKLFLISTQAYSKLLLDSSVLDKRLLLESKKIAYAVAESIFIKKDKAWDDLVIESDGEGDFANLLMILDKRHESMKLQKIIYKDMLAKYYLGDGLWRDYCIDNVRQTAHSKYLGGVLKYLLCYRSYLNKEDLTSNKWAYVVQDR